ncbi:hypothetical protein EV581_104144 [Bacillus sp. BK006]|nr:hypothetical protein EV581_104144 [Bacillus sp. BK006]
MHREELFSKNKTVILTIAFSLFFILAGLIGLAANALGLIQLSWIMDIVGKAGSITMLIIMWINWYKSDRDSKEAQKKQKHIPLAQQEVFAEELSKATGMKKEDFMLRFDHKKARMEMNVMSLFGSVIALVIIVAEFLN